jgi:UDP-N-acetylglucosamine 2-epimerase (non-hydrolysing)
MKKVVHLVAAARPNFMKVAPLYHALKQTDWCEPQIVYTGQHYDDNMAGSFMRDLGISPCTDLSLPAVAVVPGDVRDSRRLALEYVDHKVPVVHLEAGLRSFDRTMPEEINRIVIDHVSDLLWVPSFDAHVNLTAEGIPGKRIENIGNIMLDSFEMLRPRIEREAREEHLSMLRPYAVATLHRQSNVDDPRKLAELVDELVEASRLLSLVFVVHPRTQKRLTADQLEDLQLADVMVRAPMDYVAFMGLVMGATIVITDSGGVQEETTYLGIPCATLRENTERPVTVSVGSNRLVKPGRLPEAVHDALAGKWNKGTSLWNWDGKTAPRAVASLARFLGVK